MDRLAAEFRDELDALGVRVAELEKYADKVIWQGKIEYTFKRHRTDDVWADQRRKHHSTGEHTRVNQDDWIFRFEPIMEVNDHWTLRSRIDAHVDLSHDTSSDFNLVRGWAQGDYDNFQIRVGRQPLYTNEDGLIWDTEYTGADITFGNIAKGFKATIYGGRLKADKVNGAIRNSGSWNGRQDGVSAADRWETASGRIGSDSEHTSSFIGVNLQYQPEETGIFGGLGYYGIKDDDLKYMMDYDGVKIPNYAYSKKGNTNKAQIWSVNLGYKFNNKFQIWGSYARNTKADYEKRSWQALVKYGTLYGGGNQGTKKGEWAVWAGYKELGSNTSFNGINWDDAYAGTKGFVAGAAYAPFDRIVVLAKYFKGKYITGPGDAERIFARVEFFY